MAKTINTNRLLKSLLASSCAALALTACGGGGTTASTTTDAVSGSAGTSSAAGASGTGATGSTEAAGTVVSSESQAPSTDSSATQSTAAASEILPYGIADASNFKLTFAEEFNSGFNTGLWNDKIWYGSSNATKNYTVEDGKLKMWPQRDASGSFFNRTIDTDGKYYQTYGYFEIEAKLPRGKGTWPAFWLFNHIGERRPEMDVMEAYAGGQGWGYTDSSGVAIPNVYAATVWEGASDSNNRQLGFKMYDAKVDLSAGFHKYAVKWEATKQTYYFDGKEVLVINASMKDPMYLMLDLWFGSASGTPDNSTPQGKTNSYEINYVRAWQFK